MLILKSNLFGWLTLLTVGGLLAGCAKRLPLEELGDQAAYQSLKQKYDKGKYAQAVEGLEYYTLNYSGSAYLDSAEFLLAQSHFKLKEYLLAADAYDQLARRFTRSPLVPEAMFRVGVCYFKLSPNYALDQEWTLRAADALQAFIDFFPDRREQVLEAQNYIQQCRDKLGHKAYAGGMIYSKMKDWKAALIYFQLVLDKYYDTEWAAKAVYEMGKCYRAQGQLDKAEEVWRGFIDSYPEHPWRVKVERELQESKKVDK
ncbi:MAG: outer membrane protein assembly factor BamD [Calditrichota bacterium]